MEHERLLATLKNYENLQPSEENTVDLNDNETRRVLGNDINRIDFDYTAFASDPLKVRLLQNVIFEILSKFPIRYIQGMSEISSVIVTAYLSSAVRLVGLVPDRPNTEESREFKFTDQRNILKFAEFMSQNKTTLEKLRNSLINIFKKRFLIFFQDNFKLYRELNDSFILAMQKKNITVDKDVSFKYMNHVLTFFKRIYDNETVAYSIYNIILNSEPSMLFTLLVMFYDRVQNAEGGVVAPETRLKKIDNDFIRALGVQHEILMKVKGDAKWKNRKLGCVFFGVALSAVAAVGVALFLKTNNDRK